jgi:hypothetical protein
MRIAIGTCFALAAAAAQGADPVRHIGVYVTPYYEAAPDGSGSPRVSVGKAFDAGLASTRREDVAAVRDAIRARPELVTPMTMMVLAIRLYDVGLRDDSVFWFYAAKDRFVTVAEVLDVRSPALAQVEQAVRDFATLAGPTINGYAFCDPGRQRRARSQALEWVEANPYRALFMPQMPARPGNREFNLKAAVRKLKDGARQEAAHLDDPANAARFKAARKASSADERFCWR